MSFKSFLGLWGELGSLIVPVEEGIPSGFLSRLLYEPLNLSGLELANTCFLCGMEQDAVVDRILSKKVSIDTDSNELAIALIAISSIPSIR